MQTQHMQVEIYSQSNYDFLNNALHVKNLGQNCCYGYYENVSEEDLKIYVYLSNFWRVKRKL